MKYEKDISIANAHTVRSCNQLCCAETGRVIASFYNDYDLINVIKLEQENESITKACHGHIDTIGRLQREAGAQYGEIQQLIIDNVELTEQNKQMKQALSDWQIHLEGN